MKIFNNRKFLSAIVMGILLIPNSYSQEATVAKKIAIETNRKVITEAVQNSIKETFQAGIEKATQATIKEGTQVGLEKGGMKITNKTSRNVIEEALQKEAKETLQGASKGASENAVKKEIKYGGSRPKITGSQEAVESSWSSLEDNMWNSAMDKSTKPALASNVHEEGAEKVAKASVKSKKPASEKYRRAKELDGRHLSQADYDMLSPEDKEILDIYRSRKYRKNSEHVYKRVPRENGKWSGESGNSMWFPDRGNIPKGKQYSNMENKNWGRILDENGIEGIPYVNGEPDFSAVAKMKTTMDFDSEISDKAREGLLGNQRNRSQLHEEFYEKLARENGMTVDEVKAYKETNNLVVHECSDCKTMMLVPREIHDNVIHTGGVEMFRAFNGL